MGANHKQPIALGSPGLEGSHKEQSEIQVGGNNSTFENKMDRPGEKQGKGGPCGGGGRLAVGEGTFGVRIIP